MKDDFIKKLLFNQIELLIKDLENDAKELPLNKELVNYSEGKLNGCIGVYFTLFPFEPIPESLWDNIVRVWSFVKKRKGGENEEQQQKETRQSSCKVTCIASRTFHA